MLCEDVEWHLCMWSFVSGCYNKCQSFTGLHVGLIRTGRKGPKRGRHILNSKQKFKCWTQDASYFTEKSIFNVCRCVCAGGVTLRIEPQLASKTGCTKSCSYSRVFISDLRWARTSFCTVKLVTHEGGNDILNPFERSRTLWINAWTELIFVKFSWDSCSRWWLDTVWLLLTSASVQCKLNSKCVGLN